MKFHRSFLLCHTLVLSLTGSAALAADVVIGVPNWPSVQATAHIFKQAIEDRLELEVELRNATNEVVFKEMDAGTIHIHPEAWLPNLDHLKRQYVDGKKSIRMHANGATGTQATCVTKGTAERTGITDLSQLRDPEMAARFDRDGDGKGDLWIGAKGWGSTPIEQIRARSYGYDKTMSLKVMDEPAALAEVDAAVTAKQNIVFFCYTPHHMFAVHDLVTLKEPAHDPKSWIIVPPSPTPGWLEKSSAGVAWEAAELNISYATTLERQQPEVVAMLSNISLSSDVLSTMTYALAVEQKAPAVFAAEWLEQNAATVDGWFK